MSISDNAKLTSLVVVWALWPHYTLRMSGCVDTFVLYHMDITRRCDDMTFIFQWWKQYFTNERSECMSKTLFLTQSQAKNCINTKRHMIDIFTSEDMEISLCILQYLTVYSSVSHSLGLLYNTVLCSTIVMYLSEMSFDIRTYVNKTFTLFLYKLEKTTKLNNLFKSNLVCQSLSS